MRRRVRLRACEDRRGRARSPAGRRGGSAKPKSAAALSQELHDVVAVADEGDRRARRASPRCSRNVMQIREHLARVEQIGEAVDHRDAWRARASSTSERVRERARDDQVDPARQVARDVADGLARAEADVVGRQVDRRAAELLDAGLEGDARAQARLLEDHGERLADQRRGRLAGAKLCLQSIGVVEHRLHVGALKSASETKSTFIVPVPPPGSRVPRRSRRR